MKLNGLVLVGGKSTRMGEDKALIEYQGIPHWKYCRQLLESVCDWVFVSASQAKAESWGLDPAAYLADGQGAGPGAGLHAAFRFDPTAAWFVLACDFRFIDESAIQKLAAAHQEGAPATAYQGRDGKPEPLFSIFGSAAQKIFLAQTEAGNWSPRAALAESGCALIEATKFNLLHNANYKEPAGLLR